MATFPGGFRFDLVRPPMSPDALNEKIDRVVSRVLDRAPRFELGATPSVASDQLIVAGIESGPIGQLVDIVLSEVAVKQAIQGE